MARTKGAQDKQQRKSRLGQAAMVGGGVAGAGALGYGASLGIRSRTKSPYANRNVGDVFKSDMAAVGRQPKRAGAAIAGGFGATKREVMSGFKGTRTGIATNAGRAKREVMSGFKGTRTAVGNDFNAARSFGKTKGFLRTGTGKVALAGGALAAGGAAYGVYKMLKNRKKNRG